MSHFVKRFATVLWISAAAVLWTTACGPKEEGGDPLVARGKVVYQSNCMACHAPDPNLDGGLGPAVAGASLELLRARVVDGNYPPGYQPKRDTRVMVALPFLEPELPALAAYLAAAATTPE